MLNFHYRLKNDTPMNNQHDRALAFATYTVLYVNDTVCNCVRLLSPMIAKRDKETRKIYGALKKRANAHLRRLDKVLADKAAYYADFCGEMDDKCDPLLDNYKHTLERVFASSNVQDASYYAHIEMIRTITAYSVKVIDALVDKIKEHTPLATRLRYWQLVEMPEIADNLAKWVYREIPADVSIDFNACDDVMSTFNALCEAWFDYDSYYEALQIVRDES